MARTALTAAEWNRIKKSDPRKYMGEIRNAAHILARLAIRFRRAGTIPAFPAKIETDVENFLDAGANVFQRHEKEEVPEMYRYADSLDALGLQMEKCGSYVRGVMASLNEMRPACLPKPDFAFDGDEWEIYDKNAPCDEDDGGGLF